MSHPQIVGVGLATIDILMRLSNLPTWETGGPVQEIRMDGGGPVGTGLVAAARLGARVGYVGTCGSDASGKLKLELLAQDGVDISQVVFRPGPERQIILCYVHKQTGERMFAGARTEEDFFLRPDELDRTYITGADYLHLDGYHYEAALQAAQWMRLAGKPVMLDGSKVSGTVSSEMGALVRLTDILICGSGFAPGITGIEDPWEAGRALLSLGPRIVVMTEGDQGSYTVTAGDCFHTPAFSVQVVDTTGAGDVFHGAYLFALLKVGICARLPVLPVQWQPSNAPAWAGAPAFHSMMK